MSCTLRVGVVLSALLVASCDELTWPTDAWVLDVSISVSPLEIAIGDTATVVIEAVNTTDRELRFSSNSCVLVMRVEDSTGNTVWGGGPCLDILLVNAIAPGESVIQTFLFDGMGLLADGSGEYPLPLGVYRVQAGVTQEFANPSGSIELRIVDAG